MPHGLKLKLLVLLSLLLAGGGIYLPSLSYEFLSWDDGRYILDNVWIRKLTAENVAAIFSKPFFHNYLPFHLLSYQLDYALWGPRALGFHLHSVLLHAVNVVLACLTMARLGSPWPVAAATALLFAVHPSHVESVAWLSSRKDLLSMTFALLATLAYRGSRDEGRRAAGCYLLSVACYGVAVMSKAIVVLLPVLFVCIDRLDTRAKPAAVGNRFWSGLRGKIPFAIWGGALSVVNFRVQARELERAPGWLLDFALVRGYAVGKYFLVLCGIEAGRPAYDVPEFGLGRPETYVAAGGLLLGATAVAVLWQAWKRRVGVPLLGTSWLVLMLLPALAFPLVTFMADRYLYASSLGFVWLLAAAAFAVAEPVRSRALRQRVPWVALAACAAAFSARTIHYLPVWRNSETLWSHVVETSRSRTARSGLAAVRMDQGRFAEAEQLLGEGAATPDANTRRMLGILRYKQGEFSAAIREYEQGIALCRRPPGCGKELLGALYYNAGVAFWHRHDYRASALAFEEAFRADPDKQEARRWAAQARQLIR